MHVHPYNDFRLRDGNSPLVPVGGVAISDKLSHSGGKTYIGPSLVLSAGPTFQFAPGRHETNLQAALDEGHGSSWQYGSWQDNPCGDSRGLAFAVQGFAEGSTTRNVGGLARNWGMTAGGKLTVLGGLAYASLLGGLAMYTQDSPQEQHPIIGVEAGIPAIYILPGFKISSVLNPQDPSEYEVTAGVALGW